ncbi:MAG: hypothetical protein WBE26_13215, partial [Phycisphaerae bacterium]
VQRANLDERHVEDLAATSELALEAIALDLTHERMYWVESGAGMIRRADLDGTDTEDLATGLVAPVGLALDVPRGKMYWTAPGDSVIQRANLDGTSMEDVLDGGLHFPLGIALQLNCDNGVVDAGETCDIAIPEGSPGACPTSCDDTDPCTVDTLLDDGTCTAWCEFTPITAPVDDDGCCPPGANANTDNDCTPSCGNAACEPGEDEINCPRDCGHGIPTVSGWGVVVMSLLLLTVGKIRFGRQHQHHGATAASYMTSRK